MKNKLYLFGFTEPDVSRLVFCMRFFVKLSKRFSDTPLEMYPKHCILGITALIHDLLRQSGYYDNNE